MLALIDTCYYGVGVASVIVDVYPSSYLCKGGGLFGILGKYANRYGKDPIVLLGMLVHLSSFLLIYYNIPNNAVQEDVLIDQSYGKLFNPSKYV